LTFPVSITRYKLTRLLELFPLQIVFDVIDKVNFRFNIDTQISTLLFICNSMFNNETVEGCP